MKHVCIGKKDHDVPWLQQIPTQDQVNSIWNETSKMENKCVIISQMKDRC